MIGEDKVIISDIREKYISPEVTLIHEAIAFAWEMLDEPIYEFADDKYKPNFGFEGEHLVSADDLLAHLDTQSDRYREIFYGIYPEYINSSLESNMIDLGAFYSSLEVDAISHKRCGETVAYLLSYLNFHYPDQFQGVAVGFSGGLKKKLNYFSDHRIALLYSKESGVYHLVSPNNIFNRTDEDQIQLMPESSEGVFNRATNVISSKNLSALIREYEKIEGETDIIVVYSEDDEPVLEDSYNLGNYSLYFRSLRDKGRAYDVHSNFRLSKNPKNLNLGDEIPPRLNIYQRIINWFGKREEIDIDYDVELEYGMYYSMSDDSFKVKR